ncbi:MAG: hypothetical protein ACKV1O_22360 [Saprospiraceae bacterium]
MVQQVFNSSKITLSGLDDSDFSENGLVVSAPKSLLGKLGYGDQLDALSLHQPTLVNGAIQNAPTGIIQDPAGSAIGSGVAPSGGGGSGAIYSKFHPLDPIPAIKQGESIFNTAPAGQRLLHTYSPNLFALSLSPSLASDCQKALEHIANAYANAYLAGNYAATLPGGPLEHVNLLNFSPISAAIFAGAFKYNFGKDSKGNPIMHLHPSYTLTALWIAQASLLAEQVPLLASAIYFYDKAVFKAVQAVMDDFLA